MNVSSKLKRIKQQADNLFLRGDRTDVLGELKHAEDRVEELRVLSEALTRSIEKCLHTHLVIEEKKYRKVPENQAAEALKDVIKDLAGDTTEHTLFKNILELLLTTKQALGYEVVLHEEDVEKQVLDPVHKLLKDDFQSIAKQKKSLKQAGLDLDAAKGRWLISQNNPNQKQKMDTYREELDDAELKFDQTKDSYACDLFTVLGHQRRLSYVACEYLELKRDYLQKAINKLDKALPQMRQQLNTSTCSSMYGVSLHDHLTISKQNIAIPIDVCVRRLIEVGLHEEGLFRVAGSTSKVRRLKGAFDANLVSHETLAAATEYDRDYDVHVIAGTLKCYLRELPEPLLTHIHHDQWLEAARRTDHQDRLKAMWCVINSLPANNYANLRYVIKFLAMLAGNSSVNKMTVNNIAIVIAPNLIWSQRESEDPDQLDITTMGRNMTLGSDYRIIVEHLIEYCHYFFNKENVDFGIVPKIPLQTGSESTTSHNGTLSRGTTSHRRTGSSDLSNVMNISSDKYPLNVESESPKQPQRRKKQAPRPPPIKGSEEELIGSGHTSITSSPEQSHSHTKELNESISTIDNSMNDKMYPPASPGPNTSSSSFSTPAPAPRLHHVNSIRRPAVEPPKPPTALLPVKPPRPSPPLLQNDRVMCDKTSDKIVTLESKSNNLVVLGFDDGQECKTTTTTNDSDIDVISLPKQTVNKDSKDKHAIGFVFDFENENIDIPCEQSSNLNTASFRKSLESVLLQQAAGQPVVLPRHQAQNQQNQQQGDVNTSSSKDSHSNNTNSSIVPCSSNNTSINTTSDSDHTSLSDSSLPVDNKSNECQSQLSKIIDVPQLDHPIVPGFPVPAQRSLRDSNLFTKPEPAPRSDKPAVPDKPSTINRIGSATESVASRPQLPEKPVMVQRPAGTSAASVSVTPVCKSATSRSPSHVSGDNKEEILPPPTAKSLSFLKLDKKTVVLPRSSSEPDTGDDIPKDILMRSRSSSSGGSARHSRSQQKQKEGCDTTTADSTQL